MGESGPALSQPFPPPKIAPATKVVSGGKPEMEEKAPPPDILERVQHRELIPLYLQAPHRVNPESCCVQALALGARAEPQPFRVASMVGRNPE